MDFDQLAAQVGDDFTLAGIPVTLTAATPAEFGGSLVFEGPLDQPLEQATHSLSHPDLGTGNLFVVPIGVSATGRAYEAVFN